MNDCILQNESYRFAEHALVELISLEPIMQNNYTKLHYELLGACIRLRV